MDASQTSHDAISTGEWEGHYGRGGLGAKTQHLGEIGAATANNSNIPEGMIELASLFGSSNYHQLQSHFTLGQSGTGTLIKFDGTVGD